MIRSLRTGIAGLRSNQLRLDVIGNNIAGVNTTAFKRSRVLFQDALAQRISTGGRLTGPAPTSISDVGNGVSVGAIDQVWEQGALEYTNLATDLAIAGDGFFIAKGTQGQVLTRNGATQFDADGYLVTTGGLRIQGWAANPDGSVTTGPLQDVRLDPSVTSPPKPTDDIAVAGNLSAERVANTGEPVTMSTVVYDGTGQAHTLVLTLTKTVDAAPSVNAAWEVTSAEIEGATITFPPTTFEFDANGELVTTPLTVDLSGTFDNGTPLGGTTGAITVDLDLTQYGGSTTATVTGQDGSAAGDLIDYGFDQTGTLVLSFSNGVRQSVAQLAFGDVSNPDGLSQVGDGFYATTAASGDLRFGRAGSEISSSVISGALEGSNVDLAQEFTDMIIAQRGYQANARVITTSDELLQETVQLKR
ncbi:flagellar hook protein FlgE [Rubrivirga sp.]|uniref:flagellar hook protein FlgE n=1 Tax=Rubrivirga sp. TaxID=1885344 RepID=UPI003B5238B6